MKRNGANVNLNLILVAVAVGFGLGKPDVPNPQTGIPTLVHQDLELPPKAVAAVGQNRTIGTARADPPDLVMPDGAGAILAIAVPLVVFPGLVAVRVGPALGIASVPLGVPLHQELVG